MAEQPKLLVPREEDDRLALELQGTGIPLVCAPVTQRIPTPSEEWSDPIRRLQDGEYEWVVVSSVATARFLDDHYVLDELFANTRVAAIGAASANARVGSEGRAGGARTGQRGDSGVGVSRG